MVEVGRCGDHFLAADGIDVRQRRKRIDQHVAREQRLSAQPVEYRLGPAAGEEVPALVGVAAALAADVEAAARNESDSCRESG